MNFMLWFIHLTFIVYLLCLGSTLDPVTYVERSQFEPKLHEKVNGCVPTYLSKWENQWVRLLRTLPNSLRNLGFSEDGEQSKLDLETRVLTSVSSLDFVASGLNFSNIIYFL